MCASICGYNTMYGNFTQLSASLLARKKRSEKEKLLKRRRNRERERETFDIFLVFAMCYNNPRY